MSRLAAWISGAALIAILALGVAVPALAQDSTEGSGEQATEAPADPGTQQAPRAGGDHNCPRDAADAGASTEATSA